MTTITVSVDRGATFDFWTGQTYTRSGAGPWVYTNSIDTVIGTVGGDAITNSAQILDFSIGSTVTTIYRDAFLNCFNAGSGLVLTIPNSVTSIGQGVFSGALFTGFALGSGVATIGSGAFSNPNCATITVDGGNTNYLAIDNVLYTTGQTTLTFYPALKAGTSYPIPDVTTTILSGAFSGNTILTTVITGTGLTTIGGGVFGGCTALATFTNNSLGLTTIGEYAFSENAFSTFVIPNSVTTMGDYVFQSCTNLQNLTIGSGVPSTVASFGNGMSALQNYFVAGGSNFSASQGVLYNIIVGDLVSLPPANTTTSLIIPEGIVSITGFQACGNNSNVTSITFPSTITTVGNYACSYNSALTSITFPNGVNPTFAGNCFDVCPNLTDLYIPNSFTVVGNLAVNDFGGCTKLQTDTGAPYQGTLHTDSVSGDYVYDLFLPAGQNGFFVNYDYNGGPVICFKEGSKILTDKGYQLVQDLRKGDLVKTLKHDFVPINMIGKKEINNPSLKERIKDQLYKCSNDKFPEVFEDLVITGCHSILINNCVTPKQIEQTKEVLGGIYITDDKFRMPACIDERTSVYEVAGKFTIYHIALDHDNYYMNYGIYANGLLVESISQRGIKDLSDLIMIE